MTTLGRVLTNVTSDPSADPDRIAELSDQLSELVTDGLAPTLAEVRNRVKSGSPDGPRLSKIEKQATTDLQTIQSALPTDGRLGQSTNRECPQDTQECESPRGTNPTILPRPFRDNTPQDAAQVPGPRLG